MLTLYLETCTPFFDFFTDKVGYALPPEEMKLLACALIFRTLGQLVINAHTVLDINTSQQPSEMFRKYIQLFIESLIELNWNWMILMYYLFFSWGLSGVLL